MTTFILETGYSDVVTGCSARFSMTETNLFFNDPGICDPEENKEWWSYTGCKCADWMPCICRIPEIDSSPTASPTASTIEDCNDSPFRFKVWKDGRKITRSCGWVRNRDTVSRCALGGVASMCANTCGSCNCADGELMFDIESNGEMMVVDCSWVQSRQTRRCAIDGISDTCRATCDSGTCSGTKNTIVE